MSGQTIAGPRAVLAILALCLPLAVPVAGQETLLPTDWWVVGPFPVGSREGFVRHLADSDGHLPAEWPPELIESRTYPSLLAEGGRVGWRRLDPPPGDPGGSVTVDLTEGVDWEARQAEWGMAGIANAAWLRATLEVPRAGLWLLRADRCRVLISGREYPGDPYGAGLSRHLVALPRGEVDLLVASVGFGPHRELGLRFEPIDPAGSPLAILEEDLLLPDLVAGVPGEGWAGIPVMNLSNDWVDEIRLEIEGHGASGLRKLDHPLAPGAIRKVAVPMRWAAPSTAGVPALVRVAGEVGAAEAAAELEVRGPREPRRVTFLSPTDRSAQYYGLRPPVGAAPPQGYGLILSTHGAGVEASGQVRSHGPKTWAYVAAPTNRRPFGFDWHDWGRLDFLEVWDDVVTHHRVDPDRVSLVGHSMGGHGAWILGVHHADRLASLTPSAGWNSHDTYIPDTLRRSRLLARPEIAEIWLRATAADRVAPWLENLRHVPVLAVHGAEDDNVPPTHSRMLVGALENLGIEAELREIPGQEHWWDLDEKRPGADCIDAAWLEELWRSSRRARAPERVTLVTPDLDISRRMHWVEVLAPRETAVTVRVEGDASSAGVVELTTRNVAEMVIRPPCRSVDGGCAIRVDGEVVARFSAEVLRRGVRLDEGRHGWRVSRRLPISHDGRNRFPGGLKKALFEPFVIVVGTSGSADRREAHLHLARSLAHAWWRRGNGDAPIVRDVDLSESLRRDRNLVLLGGPATNRESRSLRDELLVAAGERGIRLRATMIEGTELAAAHWQPDPRRPERKIMVFQGTGPEADALLPLLLPIGSGIGLPDYIVAGPEMRTRSWGGFREAGWWDPDFR